MTYSKKATIKTTGESILNEAMTRPGVAEVLKVYERANKQLQTNERVTRKTRFYVIYSSSDST